MVARLRKWLHHPPPEILDMASDMLKTQRKTYWSMCRTASMRTWRFTPLIVIHVHLHSHICTHMYAQKCMNTHHSSTCSVCHCAHRRVLSYSMRRSMRSAFCVWEDHFPQSGALPGDTSLHIHTISFQEPSGKALSGSLARCYETSPRPHNQWLLTITITITIDSIESANAADSYQHMDSTDAGRMTRCWHACRRVTQPLVPILVLWVPLVQSLEHLPPHRKRNFAAGISKKECNKHDWRTDCAPDDPRWQGSAPLAIRAWPSWIRLLEKENACLWRAAACFCARMKGMAMAGLGGLAGYA